MTAHSPYDGLPLHLKEMMEDRLHRKIIDWTKPDCGLSAAIRYSLQLEDKRSVFLKAATDDATAEWLRTEHRALGAYKENCMPAIIDWIDEPGSYPVLLTQDFSAAYWAAGHSGVSWRNGDIDLLLDAVKKLSAIKGDPALPKFKNSHSRVWARIASNPDGFLRLKLCSRDWLQQAIHYLAEAENTVNNTGATLVHGDLRSDNICIDGSRVIFVDWSHAGVGSKDYDLANLLPALHLEGGPPPYQLMPDAASQAAWLCGRHVQQLSKSSTMPAWLIQVLQKLIAIELTWAAQCLNMDIPDGTK